MPVLTGTLVVGQPSAAAPGSFYPADGNGVDILRGRNAALNNGVAYGPGVSGHDQDQAFSFQPVPAYQPAATAPTVDVPAAAGAFGTSDFTVGFNVKTAATTMQALVGNRDVCGAGQWWDVRMQPDGHILLELFSGGAYLPIVSTGTAVNDGTWHSVAVTRRASNVAIYIDTAPSGSASSTSIINVSSGHDVSLGTDPCTGLDGTRALFGSIDNLGLSQP